MSEYHLSKVRWAAWADEWDDRKLTGTRLWGEIQSLAASFWRSMAADDGIWSSRTKVKWHHLVLAVANFKRSSGRLVPYPQLLAEDPEDSPPGRCSHVSLPDAGPIPRVGDASKYEEAFRPLRADGQGMGVPTASTLLTALWPEDHIIIDRRALAALFAVHPEGWAYLKELHAHEYTTDAWVHPSWRDYVWYRDKLTEIDPIERQSIERALYALDRRVSKKGQGWDDYQQLLQEAAISGP